MFCKNCGNETLNEVEFCKYCGTKQSSKTAIHPEQDSSQLGVADIQPHKEAPSWIKRNIVGIIVVSVIATVAYSYEYLNSPCNKPLKYSIGEYDGRFGYTRSELKSALIQSEKIWEESVEKELFHYVEGSDFKVNFIYDYRQEAQNKSDKIISELEITGENIDLLEGDYDSELEEHNEMLRRYDNDVSNYNRRFDVYDRDVVYWNSSNGTSVSEYRRLVEEEKHLNRLWDAIEIQRINIGKNVERLDLEHENLIELTNQHNKRVDVYDDAVKPLSEEYDAGIYYYDRINIYTFEGRQDLINLLSHEFGHAIGLDHSMDPGSLMYYLIHDGGGQAIKLKISEATISELGTYCK